MSGLMVMSGASSVRRPLIDSQNQVSLGIAHSRICMLYVLLNLKELILLPCTWVAKFFMLACRFGMSVAVLESYSFALSLSLFFPFPLSF